MNEENLGVFAAGQRLSGASLGSPLLPPTHGAQASEQQAPAPVAAWGLGDGAPSLVVPGRPRTVSASATDWLCHVGKVTPSLVGAGVVSVMPPLSLR